MQVVVAAVASGQRRTDVVSSVAPAPAASPVNTSITWFVLYAPVDVSSSAVGGGGIVGVKVAVAVCPN